MTGSISFVETQGIMPVTPLHIGPAIPLKVAAGRYFSLSAFALTQVAMDIEPIVRTLRGDLHLHGFTHTYIGAMLIAVFMFPLSFLLCPYILRVWNWLVRRYHMGILAGNEPLKMVPVGIGVLVGAFSHVAIDSIMHADMQPLAPFSKHNHLANIISIDALDLSCLFLGVIGVLIYILLEFVRRR